MKCQSDSPCYLGNHLPRNGIVASSLHLLSNLFSLTIPCCCQVCNYIDAIWDLGYLCTSICLQCLCIYVVTPALWSRVQLPYSSNEEIMIWGEQDCIFGLIRFPWYNSSHPGPLNVYLLVIKLLSMYIKKSIGIKSWFLNHAGCLPIHVIFDKQGVMWCCAGVCGNSSLNSVSLHG